MPDDRIPFSDQSFDVVLHNMVGEHMVDMAAVLREISRVLKPCGLMLSVFPTREVLREEHCGVPLAHPFTSDSRIGYLYLRLVRSLGWRCNHGAKTPEQWVRDFQIWLRDWCHYRSRAEVKRLYIEAGFTLEPYELPYITARLSHSGRDWALPIVRCMPLVAREALRRLGTDVILSRRQVPVLRTH